MEGYFLGYSTVMNRQVPISWIDDGSKNNGLMIVANTNKIVIMNFITDDTLTINTPDGLSASLNDNGQVYFKSGDATVFNITRTDQYNSFKLSNNSIFAKCDYIFEGNVLTIDHFILPVDNQSVNKGPFGIKYYAYTDSGLKPIVIANSRFAIAKSGNPIPLIYVSDASANVVEDQLLMGSGSCLYYKGTASVFDEATNQIVFESKCERPLFDTTAYQNGMAIIGYGGNQRFIIEAKSTDGSLFSKAFKVVANKDFGCDRCGEDFRTQFGIDGADLPQPKPQPKMSNVQLGLLISILVVVIVIMIFLAVIVAKRYFEKKNGKKTDNHVITETKAYVI
jgi:hypothetical protein